MIKLTLKRAPKRHLRPTTRAPTHSLPQARTTSRRTAKSVGEVINRTLEFSSVKLKNA